MICLDTTFLVDLWRDHPSEDSSARSLLERHSGEEFVVPCHAAGEFLEGGATISEARLAESLLFLDRRLGAHRSQIERSQPPPWRLGTKHFNGIPDLELLSY